MSKTFTGWLYNHIYNFVHQKFQANAMASFLDMTQDI